MPPCSRCVPALTLFAALLTGCGSSGNSSQQAAAALPTGIVSASGNPQVATYSITPSLPGNVTIEFGEDTNYGFSTSAQHTPAPPAFGLVTTLVAGMKANTAYHMRARVDYDNGTSITDTDHTFTTGAITPGYVPSFTVNITPGMTPQPGIELVDIVPSTEASSAFATDLTGNVIWTYIPPESGSPGATVYPVKLLPNGHFMCLIGPSSNSVIATPVAPGTPNVLREFDLAGNTVRELKMTDLNTRMAAANFNIQLQAFTHDFQLLPNGHVLVMANTTRQFTNLPGYPGTITVAGDLVIDLDENFNPVWVWNEFDHFDINRHPMSFPDWTHSNAIVYSQDDGNFLVSIRHQNWIVKVDYRDGAGTGNVLWKLGYQGDFKLEGATDPTNWFYAQHDVNFVSTNTTGSFQIAIMDNGDDRVFPAGVTCDAAGAPPCQYTTIPIMKVDENARTASFVFHQTLPTSLYSVFAGSTRVQPNTNVEYNLAGLGTNSATIEVTPTSTPQTVWEMQITHSNTYRSFRMPSLYPGVQW